MLDYKKNARAHVVPKFVLACLASLLLLVAALFIAKAAWSMYGKFTAASAAAEASQEELARLVAQKERVTSDIEDLSSSRGVEEVMRERFGVAKPGEGEIRIVRRNGAEEDAALEDKGNVFTRIFRALFVW